MIRPISIVAASLILGGCGAQTNSDTTTATTTTTTGAREEQPAATPGTRDTSVATTAPGSPSEPVGGASADTMPARPTDAIANPGHATLVDVRVARQAGVERIVFEFDSHVPRYEVKYQPNPMQCGSGDPVTVAGGATLWVRFRSTVAHRFEGERPVVTVPSRDVAPGLPQVKQLKQICDFEGEVEWVIGVAGERPFTVSTLAAPPRIVVDIR